MHGRIAVEHRLRDDACPSCLNGVEIPPPARFGIDGIAGIRRMNHVQENRGPGLVEVQRTVHELRLHQSKVEKLGVPSAFFNYTRPVPELVKALQENKITRLVLVSSSEGILSTRPQEHAAVIEAAKLAGVTRMTVRAWLGK